MQCPGKLHTRQSPACLKPGAVSSPPSQVNQFPRVARFNAPPFDRLASPPYLPVLLRPPSKVLTFLSNIAIYVTYRQYCHILTYMSIMNL